MLAALAFRLPNQTFNLDSLDYFLTGLVKLMARTIFYKSYLKMPLEMTREEMIDIGEICLLELDSFLKTDFNILFTRCFMHQNSDEDDFQFEKQKLPDRAL